MSGAKHTSRGIVSWPEEERPRERLLSRGAQALTDAELIGILLRMGFAGTSAVELAQVREPVREKGNRETLSMVMLDFDFDSESDLFDLDAVFYAAAIEKAGWEIRFSAESVGRQVMAVFVDIYGNEARELIPGERFAGKRAAKKKAAMKRKPAGARG